MSNNKSALEASKRITEALSGLPCAITSKIAKKYSLEDLEQELFYKARPDPVHAQALPYPSSTPPIL